MEAILMKRGGINLVSELMGCDRKTTRTALSSGADENSALQMKIRKCAMNHGGVLLRAEKASWDIDCLEFNPRRIAYKWNNGVMLIINVEEETATIIRPDQPEEDFEVVGLTLNEVESVLAFCEQATSYANKVMTDITSKAQQ